MRSTWAIGALVAAAALQLVVTLAPDAYSIFGPYFLVDSNMVLRALRAIVPFGLAAAVVYGAIRWPESRIRLSWAASALAVAGASALASDVLFASWSESGDFGSGFARVALPALFLIGAAANAVAIGLLAGALWSVPGGRDERTASEPPRRVFVAGVGVLGAGCTAATAWSMVVAGNVPPEFAAAFVFGIVFVATGIGALALLAAAAIRAKPPGEALPELLLAAGATLAMLGLTAEWVLPTAFLGSWGPSTDAAFLVARVTTVVGYVTLAAGFLAGGLIARRATAEPAA